MEIKKQIGIEIKNKRLSLNLRMDDVANKAGITRSTLWSIENGSGNYSIDILLKILKILEMSINIETQTNARRKRAVRLNSAFDKKINRFIVMCVEQFALSINKNSNEIYPMLKEKGILQELKDDYEDMHGMSTTFINEYIKKRLEDND